MQVQGRRVQSLLLGISVRLSSKVKATKEIATLLFSYICILFFGMMSFCLEIVLKLSFKRLF